MAIPKSTCYAAICRDRNRHEVLNIRVKIYPELWLTEISGSGANGTVRLSKDEPAVLIRMRC